MCDNILYIDINEPHEQAQKLILPSIPCEVRALNVEGWADYKWSTIGGELVQAERKQWGEVLSGIDKVEDQLRRHKTGRPDTKLLLIVEGLVDNDSTGTFIINKAKSGAFWTRGYRSGTSMFRVLSWLYSISGYLEIFFTSDYAMTCQFLVAAFKQDQKEDKKTFQRHFKQIEWHDNPQVTSLIGLVPGIGEVKAKALIREFVTVWQVLNASPEELSRVPGIGNKTALHILRGVGRTNV